MCRPCMRPALRLLPAGITLAGMLLTINASAPALDKAAVRPIRNIDQDEPTTAAPVIPQMSAEDLHRPTRMPDRIILTWADDPATTQAVTWRTSTDVKNAVAQIAEADPGPNLEKLSRTIPAVSEELETNLSKALYHSVRFEHLSPSTKYVYRVGDGANWSEWFQFQTASLDAEPFSFVYFGDAQNDVRSLWSRVVREAYTTDPGARFLLHAGDLINRAESDAEWGEWHQAGGWLNAMIPSVPVPGNHEQHKLDDETRRLSHHWRPQFTLPENGPTALPESCYTIVYQDTLIVALNSNEETEIQAEWLDQVLTANESRWTICTFHHPLFSTGKDRDNEKLRKQWKPVLDKHRVDLVLQGHDHTYGRTGLTTPGPDWVSPAARKAAAAADEKKTIDPDVAEQNAIDHNADVAQTEGTVYVVSVSGPKMYDLQRQSFMQRAAQDTQLFQLIYIDGDQLHFEARTATGSLYDAFTLTKQDGGPNKLTEQVPEIPERLRPPVAEPEPTAKDASAALKSSP